MVLLLKGISLANLGVLLLEIAPGVRWRVRVIPMSFLGSLESTTFVCLGIGKWRGKYVSATGCSLTENENT